LSFARENGQEILECEVDLEAVTVDAGEVTIANAPVCAIGNFTDALNATWQHAGGNKLVRRLPVCLTSDLRPLTSSPYV
jgi:hypothetical protein